MAVGAGYDAASGATSTRFMASGEQPFAPGELARLEMPVLDVPGADPEHPRSEAEAYTRAPHATLVETADWAVALAAWVAGCAVTAEGRVDRPAARRRAARPAKR